MRVTFDCPASLLRILYLREAWRSPALSEVPGLIGSSAIPAEVAPPDSELRLARTWQQHLKSLYADGGANDATAKLTDWEESLGERATAADQARAHVNVLRRATFLAIRSAGARPDQVLLTSTITLQDGARVDVLPLTGDFRFAASRRHHLTSALSLGLEVEEHLEEARSINEEIGLSGRAR